MARAQDLPYWGGVSESRRAVERKLELEGCLRTGREQQANSQLMSTGATKDSRDHASSMIQIVKTSKLQKSQGGG